MTGASFGAGLWHPDDPWAAARDLDDKAWSLDHFERIYRPLQAHSSDLVTTLWSYLDNGRSLEATARELFVHPNTVRYRLKRVSELIGWDATGPREALILQTALIIGSIGTEVTRRRAASARRM